MKATLCVFVALVAVTSAAPAFMGSNRRAACTDNAWCTTACKCDSDGQGGDDCTAATKFCAGVGNSGVVTDACASDGTTAITAACTCGASTVTEPAAKKAAFTGTPGTNNPEYCLLSKATDTANTRASTDTCPSLAAVADKVLNVKATCGDASDITGCTAGKVCIAGACLSACATDGTAVANNPCACGVTKVAVGGSCRLKSHVYLTFAKPACSNRDGTTKVSASCTCGWLTGSTVDITFSSTADKFCFEGSTGKGFVTDAARPACQSQTGGVDNGNAACSCGTTDIINVAANKVCKVTAAGVASEENKKCTANDGSAAQATNAGACTCGTNCAAVATGEVCRIENNVGYKTAAIKCSNRDGTTKVSASCTCGYLTGSTVDITFSSTADKFCFEGSTGKGFVTDAARPACQSQTGGVDNGNAACSCGTTDIINVAANKVCKVTAAGVASENKKCTANDGSAAQATGA